MELINTHINKEKVKILTVPDVHLKCTNPSNRKKYPEEILSYMGDLLKLVEIEKIDVVIFLGDIYHDAFIGKLSGKYNQQLVGIINAMKVLGTRVFTLMGNHEKHNFGKGCLFFENIQYNSARILDELLALKIKLPDYPVATWETCDRLIVNEELCIEMHHFSDLNKSYQTEPNNYNYTISLFHDAILPTHARKHIKTITEVDLGKYTSVAYDDEMFANADYAVCGDIHARIGEMLVSTSTGIVNVDIPGSIGRVASGIAESHELVNLPLFTLENGVLTKTHIPFKLWTIRDSFYMSIVEANKQKYSDMKEFKANIEGIEVRKTFQEDLETFPDYAKTIVCEILDTGSYTVKSTSQVRQFIATHRKSG